MCVCTMSPHLARYSCFGSVRRLSGTGPGWLALCQMQLRLKGSECAKLADLVESVLVTTCVSNSDTTCQTQRKGSNECTLFYLPLLGYERTATMKKSVVLAALYGSP